MAFGHLTSACMINIFSNFLCSSGNNLPIPRLVSAYYVRYEDSFLVVGGFHDASTRSDAILKYQPETDTWAELPGRLRTPRSSATAIVVDLAIFPECSL